MINVISKFLDCPILANTSNLKLLQGDGEVLINIIHISFQLLQFIFSAFHERHQRFFGLDPVFIIFFKARF